MSRASIFFTIVSIFSSISFDFTIKSISGSTSFGSIFYSIFGSGFFLVPKILSIFLILYYNNFINKLKKIKCKKDKCILFSVLSLKGDYSSMYVMTSNHIQNKSIKFFTFIVNKK